MNSKRFTTLIATLFVMLFACVAAFGFTLAFADDDNTPPTTDENVSNPLDGYFEVDGAEVAISDQKLVFTVTGTKKATIESVNDNFYLPKTVIEDEYETEAVNGYSLKVTKNTEANDHGKLEITLQWVYEGEGTAPEDYTPTGTYTITSIKTNEKALYSIEDGEITPNEDAYYVDMPFTDFKSLVWGYNYEDVSFAVYHGFLKTSNYKREIVIANGATEEECFGYFKQYIDEKDDSNVTAKAAGSSVKFLQYDALNDEIIADPDYTPTSVTGIYCWFYTAKTVTTGNESTDVKETAGYDFEYRQILKQVPSEAPKYENLDEFFASEFDAYQSKIESETKDKGTYKYIGSSTYFYVPTEVAQYLSSKYFSNSDLTTLVYYKIPGSDSFSSISASSTKRFSLSKLGEYEFYILATDPMGNEMVIDEEWELGLNTVGDVEVYGYYNAEKELMVPIFKFELGNAGPQTTANDDYQDEGYIGTAYTKVNSFSTKGNDVKAVYSLLYNPSTNLERYEDSDNWYEIGNEEDFEKYKTTLNFTNKETETFETLAWDESDLSFTPIKAGSYVVKCVVSDGEAKTATAYTRVISVNNKVNRVEVDTVSVWFENNWRSVLFLGIAVLSLIGIIVLLFVKPKEVTENEEENK